MPALRLRHDPGLWVLSELPRAPAARKTFRDPADRRGGRAARRRCRSRRGVVFGVDRTKTRRSRGELERIADDRISGRDDCAVDRGRIRICIRRGSAGGLACAIRATIERLGISRSVSSADGGPWVRGRRGYPVGAWDNTDLSYRRPLELDDEQRRRLATRNGSLPPA